MSISAFLLKELTDCRARGISVVFSPTRTVMVGGFPTVGWFDEESLHVAIGDWSLNDWLATFVHESCHKDQFVEKVPEWDTMIGTHDANDVLDMWLERAVELSPEQMIAVVDKIQRVELDCEKRSVVKITNNDLPLDVALYTRKANVYVWYYRAVMQTRRWVTAPYNNPDLIALAPDHFDNDYTVLPAGFLEAVGAMS